MREIEIDESYPSYDVRRYKIPAAIEQQIVTPHPHEDADGHKPLWIIWKVKPDMRDGVPFFPEIDTVCDSDEMARLHVQAILASDSSKTVIDVERIPANHRFASSLDHLQADAHNKLWKARIKKLGGD
jgi:hypothetical protein